MAVATIRDVARQAQVSVATVSRALNGHESVTPETRRRVLDAAAALHFSPSSVARSLITRRTQTIGAVLPDLHGEYLSELIRGIEVGARAHELHLLVSSAPSNPGEIASALRVMRGRVDGLIVMSPQGDAEALDAHLPAGLPAVLINTPPGASRHSSFAADHRGGAAAMTRHLLAQGHRSIAFISGPPGEFSARERLQGFRDAMAEHTPGADAPVLQGDYSERSGWEAGRAIAAMRERPSAVFAAADMMAVGCIAALDEAGLQVPRDIALAGFDDIPIARYLRPALTTVRVPIADLGALALEQLVSDIAIEPTTRSAQRRTVAAEVVVRQSCARAPINATRSP
jgi:LacI family transcriptional regulator